MFLDRSVAAILLIGIIIFALGGCQRESQRATSDATTDSASPLIADAKSDPKTSPEVAGWEPTLKATRYGRLFSIIIGIDDYAAEECDLEPLQFAVNDAREVRDVLQQDFGFTNEHCKFLTNKAATRAALADALEAWLDTHHPTADDAVLFFFAGHGLIDRRTNAGYLATVDSQRGELERSCIPVSWLRGQLAKLKCRHKLVILDSCYSGTLFQDKPSMSSNAPDFLDKKVASKSRGEPSSKSSDDNVDNDNLLNDRLSYYLIEPCFLGISAGRITPVADGQGAERHSVFTSALIQEMRDRAGTEREDQAFTFRQLAARVEARTRELPGSQQIPDWGKLASGDGDFVFKPTLRRVTQREKIRHAEYTQLITQADEELQKQHLTEANILLERCPTDLRAWEWHYLQNRIGEVLRLVDADDPLVISPDETMAICPSNTDRKDVLVFDMSNGKPLHVLKGHTSHVAYMIFVSGEQYLVSGSGDRKSRSGSKQSELIMWNLQTGERVSSADCEGFMVRNVTFDHKSERAAIFLSTDRYDSNPSRRTKAKVIKLKSGEEIFSITDDSDPRTGTGIREGTWNIRSVAFPNNDGDKLALHLERQSPPPKEAKTLTQYYDIKTRTLLTDVSPPQAELAAFNTNRGKAVDRSEVRVSSRNIEKRWPQELWLTPKNGRSAMNTITVKTKDGPAALLPDQSGFDATRSPPSVDRRETPLPDQRGVILLEDGRFVLEDQPRQFFKDYSLFTVWEAKSGQLLSALPGRNPATKRPKSAGDKTSPRIVLDRPSSVEPVNSSWKDVFRAFSRKGSLAAITSGDAKQIQQLEIVETMTGVVVQKFECQFASWARIEFSADESLVAISGIAGEQQEQLSEEGRSGRAETRIWEVRTGHLKAVWPRVSQCSIFSPDGRSLLQGIAFSFGQELCDITTGKTARVLKWPNMKSARSHLAAQFSPDGRLIAESIDGIVKIWSIQSDQETQSLRGDEYGVELLCFDHSGRRLATVGHNDRIIRLWDTQIGDLVYKVSIPTDGVLKSVMFANDGKTLVAVGSNKERGWEVTSWNANASVVEEKE